MTASGVELTYVELSVLADAVTKLEVAIRHGAKPWDEYEGDRESANDPASETAYRDAFRSIEGKLNRMFETAS